MDNNELKHCQVLPPIVTLEHFNGDYTKYDNYLYNEIFLKDLFTLKVTFRGKFVELKTHPLFNDREDRYFHLTCKNFDKNSKNRQPDLRRSERLCWLKPSLETDHAKKCEQDCFLIYERIYHNKNRIFLLNPKDRYFIVLEERPSYYLLITAYYIDFDKTLERKIEEYNKYKTT